MKNLLIYQSTEYDCGPTTLTNAIRYLFDREEIYPDIVKYIMLYCLDSYNEAGEVGKRGTSASAMMFLSNWLTQFGQVKNFPISCNFLSKKDVVLSQNSCIIGALQQDLSAPLGSVSPDSQSPAAPCESSSLATTSWWDYGCLAMEPCLCRKA